MECDKGVNNWKWPVGSDLNDTPDMKEAWLTRFSNMLTEMQQRAKNAAQIPWILALRGWTGEPGDSAMGWGQMIKISVLSKFGWSKTSSWCQEEKCGLWQFLSGWFAQIHSLKYSPDLTCAFNSTRSFLFFFFSSTVLNCKLNKRQGANLIVYSFPRTTPS